jgi:hypothetical protein
MTRIATPPRSTSTPLERLWSDPTSSSFRGARKGTPRRGARDWSRVEFRLDVEAVSAGGMGGPVDVRSRGPWPGRRASLRPMGPPMTLIRTDGS